MKAAVDTEFIEFVRMSLSKPCRHINSFLKFIVAP